MEQYGLIANRWSQVYTKIFPVQEIWTAAPLIVQQLLHFTHML